VSVNALGFVNVGIPAAVVIRLATIAATLLAGRRASLARGLALGGSIVASALTMAAAVHVLSGGGTLDGLLLRHAASGVTLSYSVTPLQAWFLLVFAVIAVPVTVYSAGYLPHSVPASRMAMVGAAFNVMLGAVELVFTAADVVTFLLGWELMTLATAALVATDHHDRSTRRAAYLYLVMSHVGTGCLVAGFLTLSAAAGSLSLSSVLGGHLVTGGTRAAIFGLFLVGFGVKAGVMPFHVWLPEAHPAAPSSVSALMSAVLITTGIYGLFRVCGFGLGTPAVSWGLTCMGLGALSAILGVLYALTQADLKRLLAYSTIENSGIIVLGLGAAMLARAYGRGELATVAVAASLVHVLNHAAFKALLFLTAGSVVMRTGTRRLEHFGGLLRRMPWTGVCFLVGVVAIAGLPPLNGFVSEWLTFQALLLGFAVTPGFTRLIHPLSAALLALTSALVAACFVKVTGISLLALPRSAGAEAAREVPPAMLLPQAALALLCLALGLLPGAVLRALAGVVASLPGLQPVALIGWDAAGIASPVRSFDHLVPAMFALSLLAAVSAVAIVGSRRGLALRRVPTWGCGGELSASTQYTATAFSKPLMMIFRAVYRPTREVEALAGVSPYYPHEVRYRSAIEPVFERYVYGPLLHAVLRVATAMKALQAGSLHAYLAYVLVLGVLLLLWLGGTT
jgi:hydrogenase-4 component B